MMRAFLGWWLGELAACLPAPLRTLGARRNDVLVAAPFGADAALTRLGPRGARSLGALSALPQRERRALAAAARSRGLEIVFAMPAAQAVTRRIALPAAAERDLDAVLGFEMDRLTPFAADEVFYDRRIAARRPEQNRLEVELTFAPLAGARAALSALESEGLAPDRADLMAEDGQLAGRSMRSPVEPPRRRGPLGLKVAVIGLSAFILLSLAHALLDLRRIEARVEALGREVSAARAAALGAADARRAAESGDAGRVALALRRDAPSALETLAALSDALPDQAWLTRLDLQQAELTIAGYAEDAAALPAALAAASAFDAPRFLAPVTRDAVDGREVFTLGLALAEDPE